MVGDSPQGVNPVQGVQAGAFGGVPYGQGQPGNPAGQAAAAVMNPQAPQDAMNMDFGLSMDDIPGFGQPGPGMPVGQPMAQSMNQPINQGSPQGFYDPRMHEQGGPDMMSSHQETIVPPVPVAPTPRVPAPVPTASVSVVESEPSEEEKEAEKKRKAEERRARLRAEIAKAKADMAKKEAEAKAKKEAEEGKKEGAEAKKEVTTAVPAPAVPQPVVPAPVPAAPVVPEPVPVKVTPAVVAPAPVVAKAVEPSPVPVTPVVAPVVREVKEEKKEVVSPVPVVKKEPVVVEESVREEEPERPNASAMVKKFFELYGLIQQGFTYKKEKSFVVVGSDSESEHVDYRFVTVKNVDAGVKIEKDVTDKDTGEQIMDVMTMTWKEQFKSLRLYMNGQMLRQEAKGQSDGRPEMYETIDSKMNKFLILVGGFVKKEKDSQKEEMKAKKLHDKLKGF